MTINEFKDWLFDVLNDMDGEILADIDMNENQNLFQLRMIDGSKFEIECRQQ